jgi:uncharacterized repeat protein (TIGR03803 family)
MSGGDPDERQEVLSLHKAICDFRCHADVSGQSRAWPKEAVLHHFGTGTDGAAAYGRVISDAAGNLYGTTAFGGTSGVGIIFELTNPEAPAGWTETVLHNFGGGSDGSQPYGGLIFDSAGNLYGTTFQGDASNAGTVYELTPGKGGAWTEETLYTFTGGTDGLGPLCRLILLRGKLYALR